MTRYLHGNIISFADSGVLFARSTNSKPKFYSLDMIECLIDSNNRIAFGRWKSDPEVVWDVELICERSDSPKAQPFSLILEQNRISSYCIDPGEYKIVCIKFSSSDEYLEVSDSLLFGRFRVFENSVTYIGTLHTEYKRNLSPGMTVIPTSIIHRRGMAGGVVGIVGYLSDQRLLEEARRSMVLHGMNVSIDSNYKPLYTGGLQLRQAPIILEQAP
jgi:hypothetical protein